MNATFFNNDNKRLFMTKDCSAYQTLIWSVAMKKNLRKILIENQIYRKTGFFIR